MARRRRGRDPYSDLLSRNPTMFMRPNPRTVSGRFVKCKEQNCQVHSGVAEFPAASLRCGMNYCMNHMTVTEADLREAPRPDLSKTTLIFYDLELSKDGEIEQIGATVLDNDRMTFSTIIRTSVRTNTSPMLRKIDPLYWSMLACEPADAIERFVGWVRLAHAVTSGSDSDISNVMLAAHNGSIHDHIKLIRMMMIHGISPPNYRLVDTVIMFKMLKGMKVRAKLADLRDMYAPWMDHIPHDADSDAAVLKYVVEIAYPETKWYCYPFGISCSNYIERTGMNMFLPSPVISLGTFDAHSYSVVRRSSESEGSESRYDSASENFERDM